MERQHSMHAIDESIANPGLTWNKSLSAEFFLNKFPLKTFWGKNLKVHIEKNKSSLWKKIKLSLKYSKLI